MSEAAPKAGFGPRLGRDGFLASTSAPLIRSATLEDAETIAQIHVASWRESYAALMPAETLQNLRRRGARETLAGGRRERACDRRGLPLGVC